MMASILFRIIPREIFQFCWYTNSLTEGLLLCQTAVVTQTSVRSSVHHTGHRLIRKLKVSELLQDRPGISAQHCSE